MVNILKFSMATAKYLIILFVIVVGVIIYECSLVHIVCVEPAKNLRKDKYAVLHTDTIHAPDGFTYKRIYYLDKRDTSRFEK